MVRDMCVRAILSAGVVLCVALPPSAIAQGSGDQTSAPKSSAKSGGMDMKFAKEAAMGGQAEVQLGQLATQKAQDPEVKEFGQKMVDDHTKANDQLKSVAQNKNMTLPDQPSAKDKALMKKLEGMSGSQFDHAYMAAMVKDHTTDVAEFKKEANNGSDSDIKNFASQTLPTLQEHLKMAQQTNSKLGGGKSASK